MEAHDDDLSRFEAAIVHAEHDEFIPDAELVELHGVSLFAPLQRPDYFNGAMLRFVGRVIGR